VGSKSGVITALDAWNGSVRARYQAHDRDIVGMDSLSFDGVPTIVSASGQPGRPNMDAAIDQVFEIDIADRPRAIAAMADGRIVVGTDQGFLLFKLSKLGLRKAAFTT
jgi:hypothetical protein